MPKLFKFFSHIKNIIEFTQLPREQRRLVFYSEGKNYWVHLEGLIKEVLATSNIPVCYISSGEDDPGLFLEHQNYRTFNIDEGFVRNWLFENIETDVMVMTMPDLHQFQVKRSKHKVHYVYTQHSLVSFHMVYRKGAFDHYDTIFCAGPHHIKEMRAIEAEYNLPPKNLVEHGYARLDAIIEVAKRRPRKEKPENTPKHALIAPSWGPDGTIESGVAEKIVDQLIDQGYKVTLRPHPQTVKFANKKIDAILKKYGNHMLFSCETNVAGQDSLHDSDFMISDWSGAALDYAFGLKRPVLFVDVPKKINNPEYKKICIEPFEISIRHKIGVIAIDNNLNIELLKLVNISSLEEKHYFKNPNKRGAKALKIILGKIHD